MNENGISILAASGMVLVFVQLQLSRRSVTSIMAVGALLGGSAVFLLGVSRTGLAGLAAGLVISSVCLTVGAPLGKNHTFTRLVTRTAIPGMLTALLVFGNQSLSSSYQAWNERLESAVDGTDRGMREELNVLTLRLAIDNPMGVGQDQAWLYLGGLDPHNGYFKLLAEGGFIALALLIAAYTIIVGWGMKLLKNRDAAAILGAFGLFAVTSVAGQDMSNVNYWFFLALVCGIAGTPKPIRYYDRECPARESRRPSINVAQVTAR
jgi:O-antigen ligase